MKTLYDILELSRQASPEAVEASYQRMARDWRGRGEDPGASDPDRALRIDAIERAYAVLADPKTRKTYDDALAGRRSSRARPPRGNPRVGPPRGARDALGLSELRQSLRAPWVWVLMLLLAVLTAGYLTIAERTAAPASPAPEAQARIRQLELEKELLVRQVALESDRLQKQFELAQRQQTLRERESAQRLDDLNRARPIQDQLRAIELQRATADLERMKRSDVREVMNHTRSEASHRVSDYNGAIREIRELKAARLGITPRQYEILREEQSGW